MPRFSFLFTLYHGRSRRGKCRCPEVGRDLIVPQDAAKCKRLLPRLWPTGADASIVGTTDAEHIQQNIRWVQEDLPIARDAVAELHRRFQALDYDWSQEG